MAFGWEVDNEPRLTQLASFPYEHVPWDDLAVLRSLSVRAKVVRVRLPELQGDAFACHTYGIYRIN